jgi:hypothetical protein
MTILAGIDEAGLGPTLGPLAVACAALRVPGGWKADTPWTHLEEAVCRKFGKRDPRPAVGDSKQVYSRGGLNALERTVLAFLRSTPPGTAPTNRAEFFTRLGSGEAEDTLNRYPWYANRAWAFPDYGEPLLAETMSAKNAACACVWCRAVCAGEFNRSIASGLNKSELLMTQTGAHLQRLAETFPGEPLDVTVDKQGGRNFYHPFLMQIFPGAWIDILAEGPENSAYRVRLSGGELTVAFRPRADGSSFCTALASMAAKYVRERCMADLNAFFAARIREIAPTAGYAVDARRFLSQIAPLLDSGEVDREILVRNR